MHQFFYSSKVECKWEWVESSVLNHKVLCFMGVPTRQLPNQFYYFCSVIFIPKTFQGHSCLGFDPTFIFPSGGSDICGEINILITLWETWDRGQMSGAPVLTLVTGYESVAMVNMAPMLVQYTTQTVNMLLMSVKIWDQHEPFATVYALHGFYMCRESNHFRFSFTGDNIFPMGKRDFKL